MKGRNKVELHGYIQQPPTQRQWNNGQGFTWEFFLVCEVDTRQNNQPTVRQDVIKVSISPKNPQSNVLQNAQPGTFFIVEGRVDSKLGQNRQTGAPQVNHWGVAASKLTMLPGVQPFVSQQGAPAGGGFPQQQGGGFQQPPQNGFQQPANGGWGASGSAGGFGQGQNQQAPQQGGFQQQQPANGGAPGGWGAPPAQGGYPGA